MHNNIIIYHTYTVRTYTTPMMGRRPHEDNKYTIITILGLEIVVQQCKIIGVSGD